MESIQEMLENDSFIMDEFELQNSDVDSPNEGTAAVQINNDNAGKDETGSDCEIEVNPNIVCQFDGNMPCCSKSLPKRTHSETMDFEEEAENSKFLKGKDGAHVPVNLQKTNFQAEILRPADTSSAISESGMESSGGLMELVSKCTDFSGCDLQGYLGLPASRKRLIFQVQKETANLFENFGPQNGTENQNPPGDIKTACAKLNRLLNVWNVMTFRDENKIEFAISPEMENFNSICVKMLNAANVEFFKLIGTVLPVAEIFYLIRIGSALCMFNFSLDDMNDFDDDNGSKDSKDE